MDKNKRYIIVLDFEANCSKQRVRDHEICEFPCVLLDTTTKRVVDEFRTFVHPVHHRKISDFINGLCGITTKQMYSGVGWSEAMDMFENWCEKNKLDKQNAIIVTCGDWDLKEMYPRQLMLTNTIYSVPTRMKELFEDWCDIKQIHREYREYPKCMGMKRMLEDVELELIGRHHSGIDDCRNTARLCVFLIEKGCILRYTKPLSDDIIDNEIM